MESVKVKKEELLKVLRENRKNHLEVFEDALGVFKQKVIEELEDQLDRARKGERVPRGHGLVFPMNQTPEYDQAIRMLEMSVEDEVKLTAGEFSQFVMDRWHWKQQFSVTNSAYIAAADSGKSYGRALEVDM